MLKFVQGKFFELRNVNQLLSNNQDDNNQERTKDALQFEDEEEVQGCNLKLGYE